MANPEHLAKLKEGVAAWNTWRFANEGIKPDLSEAQLSKVYLGWAQLDGAKLMKADLMGADLRDAILRDADLSEADLRDANLGEAVLHGANLSFAHLSKAQLVGADLRGEANLYRADLSDANLTAAHLDGAHLEGANLKGANLHWAKLREANLSEANLERANLYQADLTGAVLKEADLTGASLVETILENADLTGCRIYGVSVWNAIIQNTKQTNLVTSKYRHGEPQILVDNLELAQFIYLLLKHEKLRDVLNTVTQRGVLLLGRFGDGGLELLHAIADKLREMQYLPIIFDFDRPDDRDLTETVKTLVGLSRFVIVELSGPSVPQELYSTVPHFEIPFVPIIRKGSRPYSMFPDLLKYPWVLSPVEFENMESLLELLPKKVINRAEKKAKMRIKRLNQLFKR